MNIDEKKREGKGRMKSRNIRERSGKLQKRWGAYHEERSERIGEKLGAHHEERSERIGEKLVEHGRNRRSNREIESMGKIAYMSQKRSIDGDIQLHRFEHRQPCDALWSRS